MQIEQNISLKGFNTFGIDVNARYFVSVKTVSELKSVLKLTAYPNKIILGGGSNILLTKDLDALVIHVNLKGIQIVSEDKDFVEIKAAAGENWHEFVLYCIDKGYGGIENLSLIPGNIGTAPIQNIGAYGVELKDSFVSCEAVATKDGTLTTFTNSDCNFGYRNSIFKQHAKGKYVITSVTLKLTTANHTLRMNYGAIASHLELMKVSQPTIKNISDAVIAIRKSKLPDPKEIGNSGSFFKNPVIKKHEYDNLLKNFQDMPCYPVSEDELKVPAGYLIEKAGFKGKRFGDYGVHKNQALVLVNYENATGKQIHDLSLLIQKTVKRLFGITIEAEVNIL